MVTVGRDWMGDINVGMHRGCLQDAGAWRVRWAVRGVGFRILQDVDWTLHIQSLVIRGIGNCVCSEMILMRPSVTV